MKCPYIGDMFRGFCFKKGKRLSGSETCNCVSQSLFPESGGVNPGNAVLGTYSRAAENQAYVSRAVGT